MASFEGRVPNAPRPPGLTPEGTQAAEGGERPASAAPNRLSDAPPPPPSGGHHDPGVRPDVPEPLMDISTAMVKLRELMQAAEQLQTATKGEDVRLLKGEIDAGVREQIDKIQENAKKLAESKKWGLFGKIFGGFALGLSVFAAAATGGILAPAVAAVSVAMFTLQETGLMDKMFDAMGASDAVRMGVMIGVTGLLLAAGGASSVASFGKAAQAGSKAVDAASKAADVASRAAQAGAKFGRLGAQIVKISNELGLNAARVGGFAQLAGGVTEVLEGSASIGTSVTRHQADQAQADLKTLQADLLKDRKQLEQLIEAIEQLLQQIEGRCKRAADGIKAEADSMSNQIKAMS